MLDFQGNETNYETSRLPGYGLCGQTDCKVWSPRCARGRCEKHHIASCVPGSHAVPSDAWVREAEMKKRQEAWKKEDEVHFCACKGLITGSSSHSEKTCYPKYKHSTVGKRWNSKKGAYEIIIEPLVREDDKVQEPRLGKVELESTESLLTKNTFADDHWLKPKATTSVT